MPGKNKTYTMKAYKYDGRLHYEQELSFVSFENGTLTLKGVKGRKLIHHSREAVYTFDKNTLEYFFTDRWYTAAIVFDDEGKVVHVYCNIAKPAEVTQNTVSFVDLDVDVVVRDGHIEVVDIDEFEEHKVIYGYEEVLEKRVFETVKRVIKDIEEGKFPFNWEILAQT